MGYVTNKDDVTLNYSSFSKVGWNSMVFHHLLTATGSSDENDISAF